MFNYRWDGIESHPLEEQWVVNEHTVDSALVAVEKPHRLVPVSHLDLHACIRAEKGSDDLARSMNAWKLESKEPRAPHGSESDGV